MSNTTPKVLPSHYYGRDPMQILIDKETAVERKQRSCRGCKHVTVVETDGGLRAVCYLGKKAGTKCTSYREEN